MANTGDKKGWRQRCKGGVLAVLAVFMGQVLAAVHAEAKATERPQQTESREQDDDSLDDGPLEVRISPLWHPPTITLTPEQLKKAPILLDDGTLIRFEDWISGSLRRGDTHADSPDLDQKLFLGEAARAIAGVPRPLNEGQPVSVGALLPGAVGYSYRDAPLAKEVATVQKLLCLVLACLAREEISGPYQTSGWVSGLSPVTYVGGSDSDSPLFQAQMAREFSHTHRDWKRRQFVVKAAKKALKQQGLTLEEGQKRWQ